MTLFSNWLEIDRGAVRHNITRLREITGVQVMAIVKANAYGHGLFEIAQTALEGGANWLGVARYEEAIALREAGVEANLLVLGLTLPERAAEAAFHNIRLTCYDPELAQGLAANAWSAGLTLRAHAKLDTGMGRLGVRPEEGLEFIRTLTQTDGLEVEGVMTHLAEADAPREPTTDWQLDRFDQLVESLQSGGLRPPLVHAANSAAALYFPRARYDMIRPGIAIYGLQPSDETPLPPDFRPALSWKARLASVKLLPPGHGIGYNYRYRTTKEERIGVCPVGYADGLRRQINVNTALIRGRRVAVVGGVCMDQCMLQLDRVPEARIGDEIVLLGSQGSEDISAESIAKAWGTVNYEVVCGLSARIPRQYID